MKAAVQAGLCTLALVSVSCGSSLKTPPDAGASAVSCIEGTEGCSCAAGACGKNSRGEQLQCQGDVCQTLTCAAGATGCACRGGTECDAAGASCANGLCVAGGCTPGQKDCACIAGTCDTGLFCLQSTVCVESTGYEGGPCLPSGRCNRGNLCDPSTRRCVFCTPGTAGCACTAASGCNAGLACSNDLCVSGADLPPSSPKCYTPCRADLSTESEMLRCDADELLPGCLAGQTCTQGSCLGAGEAKPTCASDLDCPFFQACLQGGCYSNCDVNADCASGKTCVKHVCRRSCATAAGKGACAAGESCTANDGETGYCTPLAPPPTQSSALPSGGFHTTSAQLDLSNVRPQGSFTLIPDSAGAQDITVRKLWHSVANADGSTTRVDAPRDAQGNYRDCNEAKNECPLPWLELSGPNVAASRTQTIAFRLLPGCSDASASSGAGGQPSCPSLTVSNAGGASAPRWQGAVEVTSRDARVVLTLGYAERPEGQWTGAMYYFGTFNKEGLRAWVDDKAKLSSVKNGLLQRWGALRMGNVADGWREFAAVLTATRTESWKLAPVAERCGQLYGNAAAIACYPYTNSNGLRVYVQDKSFFPIPSGVTELPVAMNLRLSPSNPSRFEGRVVSSTAMHYPGNPALNFEFSGDPSQLASCLPNTASDCLVTLKDLGGASSDANRLESVLGGRYLPASSSCSKDYAAYDLPWLVPGFDANTTADASGARRRRECRGATAPFDAAADASNAALNASLSGGNPVLDGLARKRTLRFIDGALVNQSELFILFEESFDSFIPNRPPAVAYGYMLLKRVAASLTDADFLGLKPATSTASPPTSPGAQCDPAFLATIPSSSSSNKSDLVRVLINGSSAALGGYKEVPQDTDGIHYFCEDTGKLDGGEQDNGTPTAVKIPCPAGSRVIFFNVCRFEGSAYVCRKSQSDIAREPCQTSLGADGRARCFDTLQSWVLAGIATEPLPAADGSIDESVAPYFTCTPDSSQVYCDDNRRDLRANKKFYKRLPATMARSFLPLKFLIDTAFRYKTRFQSSLSGTNLGFAPQQCAPGSDSIPYCYDPKQIEEARARIDCLVQLYSDGTVMSALDAAVRTQLQTFLRQSFSTFSTSHDGFERLYAELLIMQGDDALTSAYASRFDIAAAGGASFQGSLFEPSGIDLTGVAGAEMVRLYQAVEYYQLALDRLYKLGTNMDVALTRGSVDSDVNFVSPQMVTRYLERLIRAASQKSVAWSEIAKRYQNFNRPDLARRVIERAYVGTYLESAMLNFLLLDIAAASSSDSTPQIRATIETAQRGFRMALLDMRGVYQRISDQMNYFGFPADFIPFPALDVSGGASSANAYDALSLIAKQRLDLAKSREQAALAYGKQGKVDAAQFQSELTGIRNNYENQLASVCGTFTADDGLVYPAIRKYAQQSALTTLMGDPCGRVGNGDLHTAMAGAKDSGLKLQGLMLHHDNLVKEIEIERQRAADQCGLTLDLAKFQYEQSGKVYDIQEQIAQQRAGVAFYCESAQAAVGALQMASSPALAGIALTIGEAAAAAHFASEMVIATQERRMQDFERDSVRMATESQCQATTIDSTARVANLFNETLEAELEALRGDYAMRLAMSDVQRLLNNAQRLQTQLEEAEQHAIDIQAAQNDPNVRIYQNDAIINAEVSFNDAMAMAYKLTRVFEYYTSQSYAKKEQLFLIRMVSAGQYNLENYLLDLDNAFQNFEQEYGNPDLRVLALSLRDDILEIPYVSETGSPLSENERITRMRAKLRDVSLLDSHGYLVLPFSTQLGATSPLTRDHKLHHVEVDLQGAKMGDSVARVYVRLAGTGVVRNVGGDLDYYVFPERLAVVNASLLGSKIYDPEVYRNYRFRDRPLVNTLWELIINQRDEAVNQDIDLQSLSDIRVLFYYTDFTAL